MQAKPTNDFPLGERKRKIHQAQGPQVEGSGEIFEAFKGFAATLDGTNDRHERLVKLSRDITISSKRLISLLQRATTGDSKELLDKAHNDLLRIYENIHKIIHELAGQEYWRYQRAFSPGLQEFVEAVTFLQFLTDGTLLTIDKIHSMIAPNNAPLPTNAFHLSFGDYIQGVADLTGELMRFCITSASGGNRDICFKILDFMRDAHKGFKALPTAFLYNNKIDVMNTSLHKVEQVCFQLTLRGKEFPGNWHNFGDQMSDETE